MQCINCIHVLCVYKMLNCIYFYSVMVELVYSVMVELVYLTVQQSLWNMQWKCDEDIIANSWFGLSDQRARYGLVTCTDNTETCLKL